MNDPSQPSCEVIFSAEQPGAAPPEVTVVVPLYNYVQFIAEALESVRAQTLADLDLIVIDDGSTDGGPNLVAEWLGENAVRFRKACLLRHGANAGLAATRNRGFHEAITPFILPLDADNALYPSCLEKLHRSLKPSAAAFAYCLVEPFGPQVEEYEPPIMHLAPWDLARLARGNYIDAMTLLRKSVWEKVGGYTRTMPYPGWEDYDLWLKIARIGGYGLQNLQILARYRVHDASLLHTVTDRSYRRRRLRAYLCQTYPEIFGKVNHKH